MFRSRAVAYVKPSSSCRTVLILGNWNGFLTIRLFTSLKSLITLTVLSFFGMMKVGEAHSESSCHFNTPKSHSRWISFFKVSTCFFGIGNDLPWYGWAPSLSWSETGLQSQSPSVPSNNSSNSSWSCSNLFLSVALRWLRQSASVIALRFAFSYLASKISTRRYVASSVLCGSVEVLW